MPTTSLFSLISQVTKIGGEVHFSERSLGGEFHLEIDIQRRTLQSRGRQRIVQVIDCDHEAEATLTKFLQEFT